jgi:alpha-beta hydrolase superfamily lysophospholipase
MELVIPNRKNQNISVLVEESKKNKGLAFVMHGSSGYKEQFHIKTIAQSFKDNGYTTIRFDATNSFGKSDGKFEDATTTNYYEDLEDVINWSKQQRWYKEPFILAGHSLGSMCMTLYAEKYPNKIKALAPISNVVSMNLEDLSKEDMKKWKEKGIREWKSHSGKLKRLKWNFMEDRMKYDVLKKIDKLTMPVLLMVGEKDKVTSPKSQEIFYNKLPGKKEIKIIKGAEHTFRNKAHLQELRKYLDNWIKEL